MDAHLVDDDDDQDAAAMAAAMGFTGFGNQRPAKRKFNANADAAVSSSGEKKGGNVSKTGANNAPLGVRRPLQLPLPSNPVPLGPIGVPASGNAGEIDLDEDVDATGGDGRLDTAVAAAKNKFVDALRTPGGYQSEDTDSMVAQPPAHTIIDNGPPGLPSRPSYQQNFQRSQIHQRGKGGRGGGNEFRSAEETGAPWWEGYYDARMNENPWERLERDKGLQPRGAWLAKNAVQLSTTGGTSLVLSTSTGEADSSGKAAREDVDGVADATSDWPTEEL